MSVYTASERQTITCEADEFTVITVLDPEMMIKDQVLHNVPRN